WAGVEISPFGYGTYYGNPTESLSVLTQIRQYIEQGRRVIGADRDWTFNRATMQLELYPTRATVGQGIGTTAVILYVTNAPEFERMNLREYDLCRRWAYAEAMEV